MQNNMFFGIIILVKFDIDKIYDDRLRHAVDHCYDYI